MEKEATEILTILNSKGTRMATNEKLILENIKTKFNLELPLSTDKNYPIDKLNKVYNCLIAMLVETLSDS